MRDINGRILEFLHTQDLPVTTKMVALAVKISWNTVQVHLYKLLAEGLVKGQKVGRQNQWMVTEKGQSHVK